MRSNNEEVKYSPLVPRPVAYGECKSCGYVGPGENFPAKDRCVACSRSIAANQPIVREPTSEASRTEAVRVVEKLIRDSRRERANSDAPSIGSMINSMIAQFGSLEGFSKSWYSAITTAKIEDPGSSKVLRAHEQLARLMVDANRLQVEREAASTMTDEEIKQELIRLIQEEADLSRLLSPGQS